MNKKNSIKSHYLQKALITDILGDKLAIMKGGKVFNVSPKNAFSKYDLFNNSKISDVDKIEKLMNSKLESKFIILSRRIANDKGESKVSYRESMIIRLYLYMALSRVRGRKINNIKTINAILNLEYDQRFKITNTDLDLFINKHFYILLIIRKLTLC